MTTVFYEVTATIQDRTILEDWVRWMGDEHLAEVVAAGASRGRLIRLDGPTATFVCQYEFASRGALDRYLNDHAPRLRAEGAAVFDSDQVSYLRRTGDILADTGK
jgi:hypothetical protein